MMALLRNCGVSAATLAVLFAAPASAQVSKSGYVLPATLALEAAVEAERSCAANGYAVTVVVVDVSGAQKVLYRGDHSTIHTREAAFRKAYTAITLGPIFKQETTSGLAKLVAGSPAMPSFLTVPNVLFLPGGVDIMAGDEAVAAIGVSGAPGGEKDEACAQVGIAKIKDKLPK
jgi:uncharacterized protein GlcG (DUF336 family)